MDHYNKVAELLSYGLNRQEIKERTKLSKGRVNMIIKEIRDRFFEDEKNGYTLIISDDGQPKRIAFEV